MKTFQKFLTIIIPILSVVIAGHAMSADNKASVEVPNGLKFSEFAGYEKWEVISLSQADRLAVILGNQLMIDSYKAGIPGNGKPFPDGAKMAKVHWKPKVNEEAPGQPTVTGDLDDVDFMVKDSVRFADSGGWGYGAFRYDPAKESWRPFTTSDQPPQENDAKCGFACHTVVEKSDYVFSKYALR
jgi:hypothetical protein